MEVQYRWKVPKKLLKVITHFIVFFSFTDVTNIKLWSVVIAIFSDGQSVIGWFLVFTMCMHLTGTIYSCFFLTFNKESIHVQWLRVMHSYQLNCDSHILLLNNHLITVYKLLKKARK